MKALLERKQPAEALTTAERFATWAEMQSQNREGQLYNAACAYALCATGNPPDERLIDKAVALLAKAKAGGYFNPKEIAHLKQDSDFAVIRTHPKFVSFVAELEKSHEVAPRPRLGKAK